VFQNLETDAQTDGFFETVRRHLNSGGSCILTGFMPNRDAESLRREWVSEEEYECWGTAAGGGRVTCHGLNARRDPDRMIVYPELIYRKYIGEDLVEEAVLDIAMRCDCPEELAELVLRHGFAIRNRWGGYAGEPYGVGPELVVEFGNDA